jgi:hypothetical protein
LGESEALVGDSVSKMTLTAALPLMLLTLVAVMVCIPAVEGAVYKPLLLIVPTLEFPPVMPSTDQVTFTSDPPIIVAVNCWVPPTAIVAVAGETVTVPVATGFTVTVALAVLVGSATETALTVT